MLRIEPATDADLPRLCGVFNAARAAAGCFPDTTYALDEFLPMVEGERVLVVRDADTIAGFVSVWEPESFLHHLYVSPDHQGAGVGAALLRHCVEEFGTPMSLKCLEANLRACRFYEKHGWRVGDVGESPEGTYRLYVLDTRATEST